MHLHIFELGAPSLKESANFRVFSFPAVIWEGHTEFTSNHPLELISHFSLLPKARVNKKRCAHNVFSLSLSLSPVPLIIFYINARKFFRGAKIL